LLLAEENGSPGKEARCSRDLAKQLGAKRRITDFLKNQGISSATYEPLLKVVQHPLSGLSEETRDMLLAVLPWSLCVAADERHEIQQRAVCMVGEVVEAVQAGLQHAAEAEAAKIAELEPGREKLERDLRQAEALEAAALSVVEEREAQLAMASAAVASKAEAVKTAELEEERQGAALGQMRSQRRELEAALSGSFKQLMEGAWEAGEVEGLVQIVMAAVVHCSFEESLLTALPSSLAARERSVFDTAVVGETKKGLGEKIVALCESMEAATAPFAAQVAVVQDARAELDVAKAEQTQVAATLSEAQEARSEVSAEAEAPKAAMADHQVKVAEATAARDASLAELELFCTSSVRIFYMLRDRMSDQSQADIAACLAGA
jgi:hypothetical protein